MGPETVGAWERSTSKPSIRRLAGILGFLGEDPEPADGTLPGRLAAIRRRLGLTPAELAARLGQDEHQICRWERGRKRPHPWIAGRIDRALRELDGHPVEAASPTTYFDPRDGGESR